VTPYAHRGRLRTAQRFPSGYYLICHARAPPRIPNIRYPRLTRIVTLHHIEPAFFLTTADQPLVVHRPFAAAAAAAAARVVHDRVVSPLVWIFHMDFISF